MDRMNRKKAAAIALSIGLSICCGCSLTENEYDKPKETVSVFQKDATTNYVLVTAAGADQIGSWGGGYEYELYALLANYGQEKKYAAQGDIYADYASAAEALGRGDIDGAAGDRSLLNSYCCRGYHYIDEAFAPQDYGIAMKKGGALSEKVTTILEGWKTDGTLEEMKEEWGL